MSAAYCENCGAVLQPDDVFCPKCGVSLPAHPTAADGPIPAAWPVQQPLAASGPPLPPAAAVTALDLGGAKSRRAVTNSNSPKGLKKDLRGWGIVMIIVGVLTFVFPQYLKLTYGVIIIVLGILNLVVMQRIIFVINGLVLIAIGVLNLIIVLSTILTAGFPTIGISGGPILILWGFREILKFLKFRKEPAQQIFTYPVEMTSGDARITWLTVERKDIEKPAGAGRQRMNRALNDLARLWVALGKPCRAELTISGYEDDPRELYEIPEVCAWANRTLNEIPVQPFFLTNTSLDRLAGWLCGPVPPQAITTPEFLQRFVAVKSACFNQAHKEAPAYLKKIGANPVAISKFSTDIMSGQDEVIKFSVDGYRYTAAVLDAQTARKVQQQLKRQGGAVSIWVILVSVIIGIAVLAGIALLAFSVLDRLPIPSISIPFKNIPALSGSTSQPGSICWTRELTNFDGSRADVWENLLDANVRDQLPFNLFIDDVLLYNPQLTADGYVFFSQKSYRLPELCP